jgi:2-polyprenyl-3-methyl-5-hydroxy-6-metoxy-1,4-benzoquinol methylase
LDANISAGKRVTVRRITSSARSRTIFLSNARPCYRRQAVVLAVADGEGRNSVWLAEQGLDVHAIDFSPTAQDKARALARERGVNVIFELADVHNWTYQEAAYDVVCEIFTQFSTPTERVLKWAGMRKALKPGGLLIIQGYTPKQLDQLYTRPMLEKAFAGLQHMVFTEEELEMHEGTSHSGISAVIGLTCQKPR